MIEGGVPIDIVADQLGHESVTTTFNIYRRVNPESGRKAAAAMDAVLGRVNTPEIDA
jgi:integrase